MNQLLLLLFCTAFADYSFELNGRNGRQIEECGQYREWRSSLDETENYSFISVTATGKEPFMCNDEGIATEICRHIALGEYFSGIECGGNSWSSGKCGDDTEKMDLVGNNDDGYEIRVTEGDSDTICQCSSDDMTGILRPCLGNQNWGGMREMTCNWGNSDEHSVDMTITCGKGVAPGPTPEPEPVPDPTPEPMVEGEVSFELNGRNGRQVEECGEYRLWRKTLNTMQDYTSISVTASGHAPFMCNDAGIATELCRKIALGEYFSGVECGGARWSSGKCGSDQTDQDLVGTVDGYEIRVTEGDSDQICQCSDDEFTGILRPCLGNQNWGGMREMTCNWSNSDEHSVDMTITCEAEGEGGPAPEPTSEPKEDPDKICKTMGEKTPCNNMVTWAGNCTWDKKKEKCTFVTCEDFSKKGWKCPKVAKRTAGLTCFWNKFDEMCTEVDPEYSCSDYDNKKACKKYSSGNCKYDNKSKTCFEK